MKIWSALLILSSLATAHALPPADCSQFMLISQSSLTYNSKPQFPKESERVDVDFEQGPNKGKTVSICGFSFKPDLKSQAVSIVTSRFSNFITLFRRHSKDPKAVYLSNGYRSASSSFLGPISYTIFNPTKFTLTYELPKYESIGVTVGVKIDTAPIQPLYFNKKAEIIKIPRTAKIIDIYTKAEEGDYLSWQRVKIDLKASTIQIYKKAAFPTR